MKIDSYTLYAMGETGNMNSPVHPLIWQPQVDRAGRPASVRNSFFSSTRLLLWKPLVRVDFPFCFFCLETQSVLESIASLHVTETGSLWGSTCENMSQSAPPCGQLHCSYSVNVQEVTLTAWRGCCSPNTALALGDLVENRLWLWEIVSNHQSVNWFPTWWSRSHQGSPELHSVAHHFEEKWSLVIS